MARITVSPPADHVVVSSAKWRSVYTTAEALTFTLNRYSGTGSIGATTYEVRDYYGNIVQTGNVSGTTLTLGTLPLGWYRLFLKRPSNVDSTWKTAGGDSAFSVIRPGGPLIARPAVNASPTVPVGYSTNVEFGGDVTGAGYDVPLRGFMGIGQVRTTIRIDDMNNYPMTRSARAEMLYQAEYANADPVRPPARRFVSFDTSTGGASPTSDQITQMTTMLNILSDIGEVWVEGRNEPTGTPAQIAAEYSTFADLVHSVSSNLKVVGPAMVVIHPTVFDKRTSSFPYAALASKVDVVSFHNYNGSYGDIAWQRRVLTAFNDMVSRSGLSAKPKMDSEFASYFAHVYGSFEPRQQTEWTCLDFHMHEQQGIPKENTYYFYDMSHGFWDYPSFIESGVNGASGTMWYTTPIVPLMRVWSEEVYGKVFSSALDFGPVENNHWIGSRFAAPDGSAVVIVQSSGRRDDVRFALSGTATLVGPWGDATTLTPVNGEVTLPIDTLPTYVRLPAGVTLTPIVPTYGVLISSPNVGLGTASSSSTATSNGPWRANNDVFDMGLGASEDCYLGPDSEAPPAWWRVDFPTPQRFDSVVVHGPPVWQWMSGLLDFDVQYLVSGTTWQTIGTFTVTPGPVVTYTSAPWSTFTDSYYSRENVFVVRLDDPVTSTAVRVYARDFTYGGGVNQTVLTAGGVLDGSGNPQTSGQGGAHHLALREVQVFLSGHTDGGTAVAGQPMLIVQ